MAFVNDFGKGADFVGFKAEIKGFVGGVPVTDDAEAFEVATLQLDLFGSVFTAFLAELDGIQGHADFAVFFFNGNFNRQAVAIPAWDVGCVKAV